MIAYFLLGSLLCFADDKPSLPTYLNPIYFLNVIERAPSPYVQKEEHPCVDLHAAACSKTAPNDLTGTTHTPIDFAFARKLLTPQADIMNAFLVEWSKLSPDSQKAFDGGKAAFLISKYSEKMDLTKDMNETLLEAKRVAKIAATLQWLPAEIRKGFENVQIHEEFGGSWDSLFGSGLSADGKFERPSLIFHGNFRKFNGSEHTRVSIIAHELGHNIENSKFADKVKKCLQDKIKEKDLKIKLDGNALSELFADWFGHYVYAEYSKRLKVEDAIKLAGLRNAYRPLCGDVQVAAQYPPSFYRINFALSNSEINAIACKDFKGQRPKYIPTCTLEDLGEK